MKPWSGLLNCCYFILLFVLGSFPALACVMKVQVHDFPPYSYLQGTEWHGSRVVLSQRLAEKLNCRIEYLDVPFGRALILMEEGQIDFIFNLTKTAEREKAMLFLVPHQLEVLVIGVHKSYPEWLQLSSIPELQQFPGRIALTTGSYLGKAFETIRSDHHYADKFVEVADRRAKNELVVKGRAHGVIEERDYLRYAVENFPDYQNIVIAPLVLSESPVYLALSRRSQLMLRREDILQAIVELQKAGLWPSIIE